MCVMPNSTVYESFVSLFSLRELCSLLGNESVNSLIACFHLKEAFPIQYVAVYWNRLAFGLFSFIPKQLLKEV